jgi:hypothetical protein
MKRTRECEYTGRQLELARPGHIIPRTLIETAMRSCAYVIPERQEGCEQDHDQLSNQKGDSWPLESFILLICC